MATSTPQGIPYPESGDMIAASDTNLRTTLRDLAQGTDRAIAIEGVRAQQAATIYTTSAVAQVNQHLTSTAITLGTRLDEVEGEALSLDTRVASIEVLGGLEPGSVSDATVASAIAQEGSLSRGHLKSEYVSQGETVISPQNYGALFDGVTDDAAALTAAMLSGLTFGVPVAFPIRKVVAINSPITIPEGVTLQTNGSTFKCLRETGGHNIYLSSNTTIVGGLRLITTGTNTRGVRMDQVSNVTVDHITVTSDTPLAGTGDPLDTGLLITGCTRITIGAVYIKDYNYPVRINASAEVKIDILSMEGYVRGLYLLDVQDFTLGMGVAKTASADAAAVPGHNAILMEASANDATKNIRISNFSGRDAGEHGFRLGGAFRIKNVWFNGCESINSGGCGFKVLGGKVEAPSWHENIYFDNCLVVDGGQDNAASAAFMLQFVKNVTVTSPIIRKESKTYSIACGFNIQAAENVEIINPTIRNTMVYGYYLGFVLGNMDTVQLRGGTIISTSGDGVRIDATNRYFQNIGIAGLPVINVPGSVVTVIKTAGSSFGGVNHLEWQSTSPSTNQVGAGTDLGDFDINVLAGYNSASTIPVRNGSWWTSKASGAIYYRKGGAWVAL